MSIVKVFMHFLMFSQAHGRLVFSIQSPHVPAALAEKVVVLVKCGCFDVLTLDSLK